MIAVPEGSTLRLITQPDHARFAAELMKLWRAGGLPEHPRREELLFAVREHDNGWNETDAAPRVNPATARPATFLDLPTGPRIALWERGVERFAGSHPYAALLIVQHSLAIHDNRPGGEWEEFRAAMVERSETLRETAGASPAACESDYRWLDLADFLSLAVCTVCTESFERAGVKGRFVPRTIESGEPGELLLDPFPLAGATTFGIACRYLPDRAYKGDADLGAELAACRWERTSVRVAAA